MTKKSHTPFNTIIRLPDPKFFIGMEIDKINIKATCIGFEPHVCKNGEETFLLLWDILCKETGRSVKKITSWNLRIGDLPRNIK